MISTASFPHSTEVKQIQLPPSDFHRLVHLDLKGAKPSQSYLLEVFEFIKKWGGTGILLEYEDTFPYSGNIKHLAAAQAFSKEEILEIQSTCKQLGLEIIPLVQTCGHMEFVLKHQDLAQYREVPSEINVICPSKEGSRQLVEEMVSQMLALHPDIRFLHIGCDEMYHIKKCDQCRARPNSPEEIYLEHVIAVARFAKKKASTRTAGPLEGVIIWDDMLRHVSTQLLSAYRVADHVELMVWCYVPSMRSISVELLEHYAKLYLMRQTEGLGGTADSKDVTPSKGGIWYASAFKGAIQPDQIVPHVGQYVRNQVSWLEFDTKLRARLPEASQLVRGAVLTGWVRYYHTAPLCETLPVAIPSLALCLQTWIRGFSDELMASVSKELGFTGLIPWMPEHMGAREERTLAFPGSDAFLALHYITHYFTTDCDPFLTKHASLLDPKAKCKEEASPDLSNQDPLVASIRSELDTLKGHCSRVHTALDRYHDQRANTSAEWHNTHCARRITSLMTALASASCSLGKH